MEAKEEPIKFQTHEESGTKYYIIPLRNEKTQEKLELRIFQSFNPGRLSFETREEYVVRRRLNQDEEKRREAAVVWNSAKWGTMNPENALKVLELLNKNPALSEEQRRELLLNAKQKK